MRAKFGVPNLPRSSNIWHNSDKGISNFWISGLSLVKVNCHNSRTSDDIDMKLGLKTKLDNRNKITSKKNWRYLMLVNCDVIVILANLEQPGTWIPDT